MPPEQPTEIPWRKEEPKPLPESELIPLKEKPSEKGGKEPLNQVEKAEAEAERLTTEYVAKGQTEAEHGKRAVAKAVENGRKEGFKLA